MVELLRTEDVVLAALLKGRLASVGIDVHIFDNHTNSVYAGAIPLVAMRLMVTEADLPVARRIVEETCGNAG